jgi:putative acetyltransferase
VKIRAEREADRDAIWELNVAAFGDQQAADLVHTIRTTDRFIPELSLVAERASEIIGHAMLSWVDIEPGTHRILQLGPLAVKPSEQRQGVGTALMNEAIRLAEERKEPMILIEGDPRYYARFGFARADESGIEAPEGAHGPQYFMLRPLSSYDPALRGRAIYPPETFGTVS